ncbi:hypothetical protein AWN76_016705 [Rhodothermaceae bacterium RA]|nr:hypothetical protein AWN76_016705 [Rhodothermaceae bacterium RA]
MDDIMPLFELETVQLGDVKGQGYAFTRRTVFGKAFQGIIFLEDEERLEDLKEQDELLYNGTVYHQRRSREPRKAEESFPVEITDVTSTGMGERIAFEAVEQP